MKRRVALYLRVSTKGRSVENQRRELEAVAAHKGWDVIAVYKDAGISGAKGRDERPGLSAPRARRRGTAAFRRGTVRKPRVLLAVAGQYYLRPGDLDPEHR